MKNIEPMKWESELSLGVSELDSQHKELMEYFNEAVSKCSGNGVEEKKYFDSVKETLISFLANHFRTEEQYFSGRDYPRYDAHVLEHIKLLEKLNFIKTEIENNRWEMRLSVLANTLKDMFIYHFKSYDIDVKEYPGRDAGMKAGNVQTVEEAEYYAFQG